MEFLDWKHHIEGIERIEGFNALERQQAKEALQYLRNVLGNEDGTLDLRWAARLHKTPSEPHLLEILDKIGHLARRALSERTIIEFRDEGTLDLVFCHAQRRHLFDDWCRKLGMPEGDYCGILGPPVRTYDLERLKQKIEKEQRQLSRHAMNAILILDTAVFLKAPNLENLINELEEEVYKYSHVATLVLHSWYIGGREGVPVFRKREHWYTRRKIDGTTEQNLLLVNRYPHVRLSDDLFAKFCRALKLRCAAT